MALQAFPRKEATEILLVMTISSWDCPDLAIIHQLKHISKLQLMHRCFILLPSS